MNMKSTLAALAVAGIALPGVCIESANVVGYAGNALRESGATLTSAMFMKVSSSSGAINFGSIVPLVGGGVAAWGDVGIQYLNFDGSTDASHDYLWDGEGWIDADWNPCNDEEIPCGMGLWVGNYSKGAVTFRSSGEVNLSDIEYVIREAGATPAANVYPTVRTFGDIAPVAADGVPAWGDVGIQYLNFDGSTDASHDYLWDGTGWIDADWNPCNDEEISAGQGLWVGNYSKGAISLHIAAPEL